MDYHTMGGHHWQNALDENGCSVVDVFRIKSKNFRSKLPDIDRVVLPSMRSHLGTVLNQEPRVKYGVSVGPMAFFDESLQPDDMDVITLKNPWKQNPAFTDFSDATFGFSTLKGVQGITEGQSLKERRSITEDEFMMSELMRREIAINERKDYLDKRRTPNMLSRGGRV